MDDDPDVIDLTAVRRGKWLNDCIKGTTGRPLPIIANALIALRRDSGLQDAFAFDEMARTVVMLHPIGSPLAPFEPRAITDEDVAYVAEYLQQAGLSTLAAAWCAMRSALAPSRIPITPCATIWPACNGTERSAPMSG